MWPTRFENEEPDSELNLGDNSYQQLRQFPTGSDASSVGRSRRKSSESVDNEAENVTTESSGQSRLNINLNNNSKRRSNSPASASTNNKALRLSEEYPTETFFKENLSALNGKGAPELNALELLQRQAMQLAYLHQQHQAAASLKSAPSLSPVEDANRRAKHSLTAAFAAGVLPGNASALSNQMQQLLSQQVLSPQQLQAIMQQQAMSAHQAQQIQDFYRQHQKHIQMQLAASKQQKEAANPGRTDDSSESGFGAKLSKDQQQQMQQNFALQQLMHLQQLQQQQQATAAAALQQQGLAAAMALAQGRPMPPGSDVSPADLQQLLMKQVAESSSTMRKDAPPQTNLNSSRKMSSPSNMTSPGRVRIDSHSRESSSGDARESTRRISNNPSSRESSPELGLPAALQPLFSRGCCRWPSCDKECNDTAAFHRHLNESHRLDDKSTAQCRVQMQVVGSLDKQLTMEREVLNAMMSYLRMDGKDGKANADPPNLGTSNGKAEQFSNSITSNGPTAANFSGITLPFGSQSGPNLNNRAPNNLSLPSSPISGPQIGGFPPALFSTTSLPSSPPLFSSQLSSSSGSREGMLQGKRRHSAAVPISADLTQNQEFYRTADVRPPFTYASLIRQAIIETPDCQMTLNEIYNWFQKKFAYFRRNAPTWKNAVRHNLSLHKCFVRVENVKGAVWTVDESEYQKRRPQKFSGSPAIRGRVDVGSSQSFYGAPMSLASMQMAFGENPFSQAQLASQAQAMLGTNPLQNYGSFLPAGFGGITHSLSSDATVGMDITEAANNLSALANARRHSISPTSSNHSIKEESRERFLSSQSSNRTSVKLEEIEESNESEQRNGSSPHLSNDVGPKIYSSSKDGEAMNGNSESEKEFCSPSRSRDDDMEERGSRNSMDTYSAEDSDKPLNLHHNLSHKVNGEGSSLLRQGMMSARGSFAMLHDHSVAE
ncbi:uncharacterized protein LOC143449679 isoform X3 [Clavelina lepadiformis]|uniref:uncharacterized protein LOC143449679 isoform X3 n=1 Tax=Clavelina lepadiformis TaxID=159417 RepID=UPI004041222A